jgi:hypothetical protein
MNRLEKLKELEAELKDLMNKANSRSFAPLAKQYRETLKEIEEIEGVNTNDEIGDILAEREADGKAGAVRQSRAG